jgi:hypothetical protein
MNVWCALTDELSTSFCFNDDIITSNSFLAILENYALLQFNNRNLILQLDAVPVHFAHIVCDCLNVNSSAHWTGRRGLCERPGIQPDELKEWITVAIVNVTKDMLQHVWHS